MHVSLTDDQRANARRSGRGLLLAALLSVPVAIYETISLAEYEWEAFYVVLGLSLIGYGALLGHAGVELRRLASASGPVELDGFVAALGRAWLVRMLLPLVLATIMIVGIFG